MATEQHATDSKSDMVVTVLATFTVITFLTVALRLYTRIYVLKGMGTDDILIVIGALLTEVLDITGVISARNYGLGRYKGTFDPALDHPTHQTLLVCGFMYISGTMFIKLSLLVFYTLLGKNLQFRRAVYGMMIVTVGIFIGSFFTEILRCIPLHKLWNYKVPGKCVNRQNYYYAKAALNILSDFIIYFLPVPMLWNALRSKPQKHRICFIFAIGSLVCVASCIRLVYVHRLKGTTEPFYVLADALVWSSIELNVAIVCASIPTYQAFFVKHFPRFLSMSKSNSVEHVDRNHSWRRNNQMDQNRVISLRSFGGGSPLRPQAHRYGHTVVIGKAGADVRGEDCADGISVGSEQRILPEGVIMKSTSIRLTSEEDPADSVEKLGNT